MTPCHWCFASVTNDSAEAHARWHRAHDLHAADCEKLQTQIAQRQTDMYLFPQPCSCGLDLPAGSTTEWP